MKYVKFKDLKKGDKFSYKFRGTSHEVIDRIDDKTIVLKKSNGEKVKIKGYNVTVCLLND